MRSAIDEFTNGNGGGGSVDGAGGGKVLLEGESLALAFYPNEAYFLDFFSYFVTPLKKWRRNQ